MATNKQLAEIEQMNQWIHLANSNALLSFTHMADNLAILKKVPIEKARVLAYRNMKKRGLIRG